MPEGLALPITYPSTEDFRSFYQARVAQAFTAAALQVSERHNPDTIDYVTRLSHELNAPVPDIKITTSKRGEIELVNLERAYAWHRKLKAERHQVFDDIIQSNIADRKLLRAIFDDMTKLGELTTKEAPSYAHNNVIQEGRVSRDKIYETRKNNATTEDDTLAPTDGVPRSLEHYFGLMLARRLIKKTPKAFREVIKKAIISIVFTAHPTRYLTTDTTDAREAFAVYARKLARTDNGRELLRELMLGHGEAYEALTKFWKAPVTPTDDDAKGPANFTPMGEALYSLGSIEHLFLSIVDENYRTFDDAFVRLFKDDSYDDEERSQLELSHQFAFWTTTDKDGNQNMKSEHFPMTLVLARTLGARLYAAQLRKMEDAGYALGSAPDGGLWSAYLENKQEEMKKILEEKIFSRINNEGKGSDLPLDRHEFVDLLDRLDGVYGGMDANGQHGLERVNERLQDSLAFACRESRGEAKKLALSLLRKSRMMGLGLVKYQLRETADVYAPTVNNLLKDHPFADGANYNDLEEKECVEFLDRIMTERSSAELAGIKDAFYKRFEKTGTLHLRDYAEKKPDVITMHTLQRHEVGARQNGLITEHVLAECGGAKQILEALFLQRATGLKALIVPLLEEKSTLTKTAGIFKEAFQTKAYRDYMWEMAGGDITKIFNTLVVQFAHSDNMRLMGQPAARGNIYEQAHIIAAQMKAFFPELYDLYAKDGRVKVEDKQKTIDLMDRTPNAYLIRMFQGGSKCEAARGGVRSTFAFCDDLGSHHFFEETWQGGDPEEMLTNGRAKRFFTTLTAHNALRILETEAHGERQWNHEREKAHREIIDASIEDYENNHYYGTLGAAMGKFGGDAFNKAFSSPGSRGDRKEAGAIQSCKPSDLNPVKPSQMRTIRFIASTMDAGINPAILPMRNMMERFNWLYVTNNKLRMELEIDAEALFGRPVAVIKDGALTLEGHQTLKAVDRIYRAAVLDFPGFGAATSDPELTMKIEEDLVNRGGPAANRELMEYYSTSIPKDMVRAGLQAIKASGYEIPKQFIPEDKMENPDPETCSRISFLVRKLVMPHCEEQIAMGERWHHMGRVLRSALIGQGMKEGDHPFDADAAYLLRLTGIFRSFYNHAFYDGAFDRSVAEARLTLRDNENWGPAHPNSANDDLHLSFAANYG